MAEKSLELGCERSINFSQSMKITMGAAAPARDGFSIGNSSLMLRVILVLRILGQPQAVLRVCGSVGITANCGLIVNDTTPLMIVVPDNRLAALHINDDDAGRPFMHCADLAIRCVILYIVAGLNLTCMDTGSIHHRP